MSLFFLNFERIEKKGVPDGQCGNKVTRGKKEKGPKKMKRVVEILLMGREAKI